MAVESYQVRRDRPAVRALGKAVRLPLCGRATPVSSFLIRGLFAASSCCVGDGVLCAMRVDPRPRAPSAPPGRRRRRPACAQDSESKGVERAWRFNDCEGENHLVELIHGPPGPNPLYLEGHPL